MAEILDRVCRAAGVPPPQRHVSVRLALAPGTVADRVWAVTARTDVPPVTRFLAEQLTTAHWFDQRRTRALLRWVPTAGLEAGFDALEAWYAGTSRDPHASREPSLRVMSESTGWR